MVGVKIGHPHAACCQAVNIGRLDITPAICADISITQVVGEDDDDVRANVRARRRGRHRHWCNDRKAQQRP
ncbi:MAG: hypothetical protein ACK55I_42595, partial [bacterium]